MFVLKLETDIFLRIFVLQKRRVSIRIIIFAYPLK